MGETKPKVTLIGSVLAQTGLEFVYEGAIPECGACSLRKACNNLKAGKRYRITGVRPTQHSCPVHMDGAFVVEVVEAPIAALINADMAIKNGRITVRIPVHEGRLHELRPLSPRRGGRGREVHGDGGARERPRTMRTWPGDETRAPALCIDILPFLNKLQFQFRETAQRRNARLLSAASSCRQEIHSRRDRVAPVVRP